MMFDRLIARLGSAVALALSVVAAAPAQAADDLPGYDRLDVKAAHRAGRIAGSVWYPAATGIYSAPIGENAVFQGNRALVGAGIAEGRFPLVLLSHGSGGNMDGLGWLSAQLARAGVMVLAVNHPGSTSGDSSPRRSGDLVAREADLSAALDAVLADPTFAEHIDPARIIAAGFSLGGATALNLGGLQADRAAFAAYCAKFGAAAQDCAFLAKGGVEPGDLTSAFSDTSGDPRVAAVVAVDPAFGDSYTAESVAAFGRRALLVNLGTVDRWRAADVGPSGSNLAARLPGARYAVIAPAWHFSFLGLCKPEAAALLLAERDDPICDDPAGSDRADVHRRAVETILAFIKER
jgi:predicted dienelactone hydrolase